VLRLQCQRLAQRLQGVGGPAADHPRHAEQLPGLRMGGLRLHDGPAQRLGLRGLAGVEQLDGAGEAIGRAGGGAGALGRAWTWTSCGPCSARQASAP
jgi:hypothetical protein